MITRSVGIITKSLRIVFIMAAMAIGVAIFSAAGQVVAVENDTLGIRPSTESDFLNLSLYPGAAMDTAVIVSNYSASPVTLLNYPVDGQTDKQGAFVLSLQSDPQTGVGAWVTLNADHITVPANSELEVPFRISVPTNTPPGDYSGGLIIQSPLVKGKTSITDNTAVRLDVINRQGVRIYLNVAGTAIESLELGDLKWQRLDKTIAITLSLTNTGNTILHPSGTVNINGWIGANTQLTFNTPENLLPGANFDLLATLSPAPFAQFGQIEATVISESGTDNAKMDINYVYADWVFIIISLFVLAVVTYGAHRTIVFVRRGRRAIAIVEKRRKQYQP